MLGHLQRGGMPTGYDRLLATRFGGAAVRAVADEKWAQMVALHAARDDSDQGSFARTQAGRSDARLGADGSRDGYQFRRLIAVVETSRSSLATDTAFPRG